MPPPRCPDHFTGPVSSFIHGRPDIFLTRAGVAFAHAEVIRALDLCETLLVRGFGRYNKSAQPYSASDDAALKFVVGDNESPMWFWRSMWEVGRTSEPAIPPVLTDGIRTQRIPVSMAPSKGESESNWATWGTGDHSRPKERWRGVHGGRWKLCHIFQAAPQHLGDTKADLRARFVRNFHPMNHFLFASEYAWKNHGQFQMRPRGQLGEWAPVCLSYWDHYSRLFPAEAQWFVKHARIAPLELTVPAGTTLDPTVAFQWTKSQRISRTTTPALSTSNTLEIRETANGRFHLSGFGVAIGGPNRDVPFTFHVLDAQGELIAESAASTATELGIAERGRGDYDRNQFRQTDFFVARDGGAPQPCSAIARRVRWLDTAGSC